MMKTRIAVLLMAGLCGVLVGCDDQAEPLEPEADAHLEIAEASLHLKPGDRRVLSLENGATHGVSWTVRNGDVASVDLSGTVTGLAPGVTWVLAESGGSADSARVTVSFIQGGAGTVALSLGSEGDPLRLTGVSRLYRLMIGDGTSTVISAAPDAADPSNLEMEDLFAGVDTFLVTTFDDELKVGLHTFEPWELGETGDGQIKIDGSQGAAVWIRDPDVETRAQLYWPVSDVELEIDASTTPETWGPATGNVTGRVSFEAAGLIVEIDESGTRVVGQVSDETTPVFAEFDVAQRIVPVGAARTSVQGGPLPLESTISPQPQVGLVDGGLLVNASLRSAEDNVYFTQIWSGTPELGSAAVGAVALQELVEGDALARARAWAWTSSGSRSDLEQGELPSNFAFSESGSLEITRYVPPEDEVWGILEATVEVEEALIHGGQPGARQTVAMEIVAPISPLSDPIYPVRPSIGEEVEFGEWTTRIGNGHEQLPGRVRELESSVSGVPITLSWNGGSATVRTNSEGEFLFTGLHPGDYQVSFEIPAGYQLARGQRQVMGPLNIRAGDHFWIPIKLADAQGNGGLSVVAGSSGSNTTVDGVVVTVRPDGGTRVVTVMTTGEGHPNSGMASRKIQPGRYELELALPAGYRFCDGQASRVTVEVFKGHQRSIFGCVEPR